MDISFVNPLSDIQERRSRNKAAAGIFEVCMENKKNSDHEKNMVKVSYYYYFYNRYLLFFLFSSKLIIHEIK